MERMKPGMFAISRAGHDADCIYVITGIDGEYVYLADGAKKTVEKPKKKNRKHIQIISNRRIEQELPTAGNEEIKKALGDYKRLLAKKPGCETK